MDNEEPGGLLCVTGQKVEAKEPVEEVAAEVIQRSFRQRSRRRLCVPNDDAVEASPPPEVTEEAADENPNIGGALVVKKVGKAKSSDTSRSKSSPATFRRNRDGDCNIESLARRYYACGYMVRDDGKKIVLDTNVKVLRILYELEEKVAKPICHHFNLRYNFLSEMQPVAKKAGMTFKEPMTQTKTVNGEKVEERAFLVTIKIRIRVHPTRGNPNQDFISKGTQLAVLLHELCHLRHMNHGWNFTLFLRDIFAYAKGLGVFCEESMSNDIPSPWSWEREIYNTGGSVEDDELETIFANDERSGGKKRGSKKRTVGDSQEATEQTDAEARADTPSVEQPDESAEVGSENQSGTSGGNESAPVQSATAGKSSSRGAQEQAAGADRKTASSATTADRKAASSASTTDRKAAGDRRAASSATTADRKAASSAAAATSSARRPSREKASVARPSVATPAPGGDDIQAGSRIRCIYGGGVAFRRSPDYGDKSGDHLGISERVVVEERQGDWVRTESGWLPLHRQTNGELMFDTQMSGPLPARTKAAKAAVWPPVASHLSAAKPAVTKPAAAKPVAAKPAASKRAAGEPAVAQPIVAKPAAAGPANAQPAASQPALAQPAAGYAPPAITVAMESAVASTDNGSGSAAAPEEEASTARSNGSAPLAEEASTARSNGSAPTAEEASTASNGGEAEAGQPAAAVDARKGTSVGNETRSSAETGKSTAAKREASRRRTLAENRAREMACAELPAQKEASAARKRAKSVPAKRAKSMDKKT